MNSGPDWKASRDCAVLLLLYGCGLRISEAVELPYKLVMDGTPDTLRISGKGGKTRIVPVLERAREAVDLYIDQVPFPLKPDEPVFRGVRGGPLNARTIQLLVQKLRSALAPAGYGDPACAPAFLCNSSARFRG